MTYMIDTCSFGLIRKRNYNLLLNKDLEFCFTHIQKDEIEKYANESRKSALLNILKNIVQVPTSVVVCGQSNWDEAEWGDDETNETYETIKSELDTVYNNNSEKAESNIRDALIAATAIKKHYALISEDKHLKRIIKEVAPDLEILSFVEFEQKFS